MKAEEKALSGNLFSPGDSELATIKRTCHNLCQQFNVCQEGDPQREVLFRQIVGQVVSVPDSTVPCGSTMVVTPKLVMTSSPMSIL